MTSPHICIYRCYHFAAARRLPQLPKLHPCSRLHGNSFRLTLTIKGELHKDKGWIMDFADVDAIIHPILAECDHHYLNDIKDLSNPTSERLALWLWNRIKKELPLLHELTLEEADGQGVTLKE